MATARAETVCKKIEDIQRFLEPLRPLLDSHMTRFITCNLWEELPNDLKVETLSLSTNEIYEVFWNSRKLVSEDGTCSAVAKFFYECRQMSLESDHFCDLMLPSKQIEDTNETQSKYMSPKKFHEVGNLGEVVAQLCKESNLTCVVDVGGGKGYLGASLVLDKNVKVMSIDSQPLNSEGALHVFGCLEKQKRGSGFDFPIYRQVTAVVSPETNLSGMVEENFGSHSEERICLTGLHVCGDLASTCVQLFCKNLNVVSMCCIGCCYNLLNERFKKDNTTGKVFSNACCHSFPLSECLKKNQYTLGRNARMLACQPMDRICHEKRVMKPHLFWRAVVQVHFERLYGPASEISVGRQCSKATNIYNYFHRVQKTLKKNLEITDEKVTELATEKQKYLDKMEKFLCFRLALAPVVESLIIIDKLLFLHEQGIENAYISKVFDGVKSPRCYAVIAMKKPINFAPKAL